MARLVPLLALCLLPAIAVARHHLKPLVVQGRVYCDIFRADKTPGIADGTYTREMADIPAPAPAPAPISVPGGYVVTNKYMTVDIRHPRTYREPRLSASAIIGMCVMLIIVAAVLTRRLYTFARWAAAGVARARQEELRDHQIHPL